MPCEDSRVKEGPGPHRESVIPEQCTGGNAPFSLMLHFNSFDNALNCPLALGPVDSALAHPYKAISMCSDRNSFRVFAGGSNSEKVWSPGALYERWPKKQWETLGLVYNGNKLTFYGVHHQTKVFKEVSQYTLPEPLDIQCEQLSLGNGLFMDVNDMNNGYCYGTMGSIKNIMYWDNIALTESQIKHWMQLADPGQLITPGQVRRGTEPASEQAYFFGPNKEYCSGALVVDTEEECRKAYQELGKGSGPECDSGSVTDIANCQSAWPPSEFQAAPFSDRHGGCTYMEHWGWKFVWNTAHIDAVKSHINSFPVCKVAAEPV